MGKKPNQKSHHKQVVVNSYATECFRNVAPVFDEFPYLTGHKAFLSQKIIDYIVAYLLQMLSQIRAGAVLRYTDQTLHVLLLPNHARTTLLSALKRKS